MTAEDLANIILDFQIGHGNNTFHDICQICQGIVKDEDIDDEDIDCL